MAIRLTLTPIAAVLSLSLADGKLASCLVDFRCSNRRLLDPFDAHDISTDLIALYVNLYRDEVSTTLDL